MKIELKEISIRELTQDYQDNNENGVFGFSGCLNIRPPYQREFVYKDKQREAVIHTVNQGFPLNVMYWADLGDGKYEVIDGQQRTISLCQYVSGHFAYEMRYFHNLSRDEQDKFLDYKLMVYVCSGTDSEKLNWFKTINIAGEKLTEQELRNAVYHGRFVADAKRYFSKTGCVAYQIGQDYLTGSPIRQDFLETALKWIADSNQTEYKGSVEIYMALHQDDMDALPLWQYFQAVINWVNAKFPPANSAVKKLMKGQDWGIFYNQFQNKPLDKTVLAGRIADLIDDDEVENKRGIYAYLLTGKEKYLNLRAFSDKDKQKMYQKQNGICPHCKQHFELSQMDADHIVSWSQGGKTILENGQMLCRPCNQTKSNR